jgi:hypothetical protein
MQLTTTPSDLLFTVDTEYHGPHTLTVQTAARLDEQTVAVQLYRAATVPDLPQNFIIADYLLPGQYGRFFRNVQLRPVKPLATDLSPARLALDLLGRPDADVRSLDAGERYRQRLAHVPGRVGAPANLSWDDRHRRWKVPALNFTLVAHFLRADLGRVFGRDFWDSLKTPTHLGAPRIALQERRLLRLVGRGGGAGDCCPVEYLLEGGNLHQVRLRLRDTNLPFGPRGLGALSRAFLGLTKSDRISEAEKGDMATTFLARTADAYGYAVVDAVNTLLLYEEMGRRDRDLYCRFDVPEDLVPPLRATLGSRVSTFVEVTARALVAGGSERLRTRSSLRDLLRKGGAGLFDDEPEASKFGPQTAGVHGGLLLSRSPTRLWHEAPGMLADVHMSGCYNRVTSGISVYCGRPVILEPGIGALCLAHADDDGWLIRASGPITEGLNALVPSTQEAVTGENYRVRKRREARRRQREQAFPREAEHDREPRQGTQPARLYCKQVESGVVTAATWLVIQALPQALRRQYERLTADSVAFYPRALVAQDGADYDGLVEQYHRDGPPWETTLDEQDMVLVERRRVDAEFVTLRYPLHECARRIGEFRRQAQAAERGGALDLAWKAQANTLYGVLACRHHAVGNFVAANVITATARALAFMMSQALNAVQTITDGCTFRLDQIPAIPYAECLRKKPDYPIRRAEEGEDIPFLDPATVPTDPEGFASWYRQHAKWFFDLDGAEYDRLLETCDPEPKRATAESVTFDALGCDGAANYVKAARDGAGYRVLDTKARSYGRKSKEELEPWILATYPQDHLETLPPVTEDRELLSLTRAAQKVRAAVQGGATAAYFPLGFEQRKVLHYRIIKGSGFVFQTGRQRAKFLRQLQQFEERNSAGLEVVALRRAYAGRQEGSIQDVLELVYDMIQAGKDNLTKALNLTKVKTLRDLLRLAERQAEILRRKAEAEDELLRTISLSAQSLGEHPTALVVRAADVSSWGPHRHEVGLSSGEGYPIPSSPR